MLVPSLSWQMVVRITGKRQTTKALPHLFHRREDGWVQDISHALDDRVNLGSGLCALVPAPCNVRAQQPDVRFTSGSDWVVAPFRARISTLQRPGPNENRLEI
jgi:hypothetical protein